MILHTFDAGLFKRQLDNLLKLQTKNVRTLKIAKNKNIYSSGDKSENVYFIESGQIKLLMFSPAGKECLPAIYSAGDIFGELCLARTGERQETAIAMNETVLKIIPCANFILLLHADSLLEGFIQYLVQRVSDQQDMINDLVTVDSEQRLAKTLLQLARRASRNDAPNLKFNYKITHEELSAMVGTTRPRVSKFMRRFREFGLIEMGADHFIRVKEKNLTDYLDQLN
jgi:CRP-like cAMP-binding protein